MTTTMEPATKTGIRFIVNRSELSSALQSLSQVIGGRIFKTVLACVHIRTGDNEIILRTSNLEIAMEVRTAQVQIESQGEICVNCAKLAAIAKEVRGDTLGISIEGEMLRVVGDSSEFKLLTFDPKEFPPAATIEGESLSIASAALADAIRRVEWATDESSTKSYCSAIRLLADGKRLRANGCEGHTLADFYVDLSKKAKASAIIPLKTARLIAKMEDDEVTLTFSDNAIGAECGSVRIVSNLVEGQYPPCDDVIPKDPDKCAFVAREEFMSSIRQASITADVATESKALRFAFTKQGMSISTHSPADGESTIKLPCKYEGVDIEIGFQSGWLLSALRSTDAAEIKLHLTAPNRPGLLELGGTHRVVVMPINIQ